MSALLKWCDVLRRHRPRAAAWTSTRAATSRSATARTSPTRRSSPRYRRLADEYFEVDRYHGLLRQPRSRTSTSWCSTGSPRPTSTGCCVETVRTTYPRARARAVRRPLPRPHHCLTAQSLRRSMRRSPRAPNTRRAEQIVPVRPFQEQVHLSVRAGWSAACLSTSQCRSTALPLDRENGSGSQLAGSSITYWCASSRRASRWRRCRWPTDPAGPAKRIPAATRRKLNHDAYRCPPVLHCSASAHLRCADAGPTANPRPAPRKYPKTAAGSRTSDTLGGWTIEKSE